MKFFKIGLLCFSFLILVSCSTKPSLVSYYLDVGVMHYFIPATEWSGIGSKAKAKLDITYRSGSDAPVTVNVSFFGENSLPRSITSISLNGNEIECSLENISVLFPNPKDRELRITTQGDRGNFISVLESASITLIAEIDCTRHSFLPNQQFYKVRNEFLTAISY